ncbi:unnamed protein product [Meganyctiphanes norvegica]|uniref:Uncharacterized protein n=1 Tax=Meganyctiphanes norvegica TaxID=48144 RepID=A0AAV2RWT8_MEGNR
MMTFNNGWQLLMMIASIVLLQASYGHGHRKYQPYTYGEFKTLNCTGDFDGNKGAFKVLRHICDECYNLYGYPYTHIKEECMDDCFQNKRFKNCVAELKMEEKRHEFENHVDFVNNRF